MWWSRDSRNGKVPEIIWWVRVDWARFGLVLTIMTIVSAVKWRMTIYSVAKWTMTMTIAAAAKWTMTIVTAAK